MEREHADLEHDERKKAKALGYIYGFICCALEMNCEEEACSMSVALAREIIGVLFPGRADEYTQFLREHIRDLDVKLGFADGFEQMEYYSKPGAKGGPMRLAMILSSANGDWRAALGMTPPA